jgi:hypothetical protein
MALELHDIHPEHDFGLPVKEVPPPQPLSECAPHCARASRSRPRQGIVTFEHRAFKQDGTLVCRAVRDALMHRRPEPVEASD